MKTLNPIRKGEFCALRIEHTAAFVGGLQSQYITFEIVRATKADKAGLVKATESASGSPITKWAYIYALPGMQQEAAMLFGNGYVSFETLKGIQGALTKAHESIIDAEVHRCEIATEHALNIR